MAKSSKTAPPGKVAKPHPDFPLTPGTRYWCKKVKGKMHYFGKVADDPTGQAALVRWLAEKDDILAGRKPQAAADAAARGALTVRHLCNKFLTAKRADLNAANLAPRTFMEYRRTCEMLVASFGQNRLVADLRPEDFERLYVQLTRKHAIGTLGREITMARSVFKYAFDSDLIDHPVKYGPKFKVPRRDAKRKAKAKVKHEHGARLFTADEIKQMLGAASPQLKAMILLGINCGLGNTDLANLPQSALDLDAGWLDYPRPKTGVERRCPLWPETVAALRSALVARPTPKDAKHAGLVFVTRCGQPWVRYALEETTDAAGKANIVAKGDDAIAKATASLLKELGIYRARVTSFYTLRHTTETIGGRARDQVALDAVMGHADNTMAAEYREGIEDDRLRAVVDQIHAWLWPATAAAAPQLRIVG